MVQIEEIEDVEDQEAHSTLIESIKNLDRKRKNKKQKLSDTTPIEALTLDKLISSIPNDVHIHDLKKDLKSAAKLRPLIHTGSKEQQNKIQRGIAFKEAKAELSKWQPIIETNRLSEQLVFPLEQYRHRPMTVAETVQVFRPLTKLEIEMDKVLKSSKNNLTNKDELTEAEKELIKAMSLKEAKEKRAKLQKIKALMSYQETKFKRQKKIKSKNYHRLKKREKRKQILKEFEELREKDPEAAREKLEMLERDRILERATLRHRGTNQWAKELRLHAKRDPKTREALQEQMRISRALQEKRDMESDSDQSEAEGGEEEEEASDHIDIQKLIESVDKQDNEKRDKYLASDSSNPWMKRSLAKLRSARKNETRDATAIPAEVLVPFENDWGEMEVDEKSSDRGKVEENVGKAKKVEGKRKKKKRKSEESTKIVGREEIGDVSVLPSTSAHAKDEEKKPVKKRKKKRKGLSSEIIETPVNEIVQEQSISSTNKNLSEKESETKKKTKRKRSSKDNLEDIEEMFANLDRSIVGATLESIASSNIEIGEGVRANEGIKKKKRVSFADEVETGLSETRTRRSTLAEVDATPESGDKVDKNKRKQVVEAELKKVKETEKAEADMANPNKFLKLADDKKVKQVAANMEEDMDGQDSQEALIAEAFADDDVIAEFQKEKEEVAENEKLKDIDLSLPGWGSWAGHGIVQKKNKKMIIKAPEKDRKDRLLPGVIISEKEDKSIRKFQPSSVPFPFTSADEYEASISHPVGKEWNPELAHKMLTQPPVITKKGAIIRPIDKKSTFKKNNHVDPAQFSSDSD